LTTPLKLFITGRLRRWRTIEDQLRQGSVRVRLQSGLTPNGFIMAAKKQQKRKNGRAKATASASGHFPIALSTAAWSALNMTAVVMTSG
jgi:hypothetical protein